MQPRFTVVKQMDKHPSVSKVCLWVKRLIMNTKSDIWKEFSAASQPLSLTETSIH
jgi:hypothetical protein